MFGREGGKATRGHCTPLWHLLRACFYPAKIGEGNERREVVGGRQEG